MISIETSYNMCRVANGKAVGRNVMYHDAAGSDNTAGADGDTWAYDYSCAEPTVFADGDRAAGLDWLTTLHEVDGVVGGDELAAWPDLGSCTNGDIGSVENGGAIVEEDVFANAYTVAMITVEWGIDTR